MVVVVVVHVPCCWPPPSSSLLSLWCYYTRHPTESVLECPVGYHAVRVVSQRYYLDAEYFCFCFCWWLLLLRREIPSLHYLFFHCRPDLVQKLVIAVETTTTTLAKRRRIPPCGGHLERHHSTTEEGSWISTMTVTMRIVPVSSRTGSVVVSRSCHCHCHS